MSALIEREAEQLQQLSRHDGVHTAALAIDSHHWQLLLFVLWADTSAPDEDATERYEVLHSYGAVAAVPGGSQAVALLGKRRFRGPLRSPSRVSRIDVYWLPVSNGS
ncbi:DUF4865 family protein [Streptomyces halobius]|uniref:DUF4865 family protein n=1 Tax=Streptomyces halobius TaxID=2879846 RepID=A0ABY4M094_9ACTN|nr:DUF4865 family protein [Streptomyces halobius]UQA91174.1 DUF4865 family protein [Streptomyces halobius]